MKKIVFIGVADKTHALLVLGRLLAALGHKVLLVDSTITQPIRGYLPHTSANSAVQDYEGMDVAYGYLTHEQLERGLAQAGVVLGWKAAIAGKKRGTTTSQAGTTRNRLSLFLKCLPPPYRVTWLHGEPKCGCGTSNGRKPVISVFLGVRSVCSST